MVLGGERLSACLGSALFSEVHLRCRVLALVTPRRRVRVGGGPCTIRPFLGVLNRHPLSPGSRVGFVQRDDHPVATVTVREWCDQEIRGRAGRPAG